MTPQDKKENELWIRYYFWRDMNDQSRMNYYLSRINELKTTGVI